MELVSYLSKWALNLKLFPSIVHDKMDQSELEALAVSLPLDLAHFVNYDNNVFQEEIVKWDRDQEIQKQQELGKVIFY